MKKLALVNLKKISISAASLNNIGLQPVAPPPVIGKPPAHTSGFENLVIYDNLELNLEWSGKCNIPSLSFELMIVEHEGEGYKVFKSKLTGDVYFSGEYEPEEPTELQVKTFLKLYDLNLPVNAFTYKAISKMLEVVPVIESVKPTNRYHWLRHDDDSIVSISKDDVNILTIVDYYNNDILNKMIDKLTANKVIYYVVIADNGFKIRMYDPSSNPLDKASFFGNVNLSLTKTCEELEGLYK